ncbi:sugar phosphate isomerase/epimerase [Paenibacillus sp. S150]|uniref:sugar phosphate isomerase/epimerase family protein n=1 Tax=Paenibacillus sp. S150 TaxID=2749826 RepID=UPI001C58ABFE|nr:sugar phosphate isomerase/epimerase [Paenibacillus sp. S150]MBW4082553.1 sugar phosphate isomerase/epimerase [Paenibacillus sp. S150]
MRIGGPVFGEVGGPDQWIASVQRAGYSAAYWPDVTLSSERDEQCYAEAALKANVKIAEVHIFNNVLDPDQDRRREALRYAKERLALADRVGAACTVNLSGYFGEKPAPHRDHLHEDTFTLIVDTVREILDDVKPERTFYALELFPWLLPNSPEAYLRLLDAVDRKAFGVHLDIVNTISTPELFLNQESYIKHVFKLLGPHIQSAHIKDIVLTNQLVVHLDVAVPGRGGFDWSTFLTEFGRLDHNAPLLINYFLGDEEVYREGTAYIRKQAERLGVDIL